MVNTGWIFLAVGTAALIAVLNIIVFPRMLRGKRSGFPLQEKRTINQELPLATTLVVLGIVFGSDRLIGYSFIGAGVVLSIINLIKTKKEITK